MELKKTVLQWINARARKKKHSPIILAYIWKGNEAFLRSTQKKRRKRWKPPNVFAFVQHFRVLLTYTHTHSMLIWIATLICMNERVSDWMSEWLTSLICPLKFNFKQIKMCLMNNAIYMRKINRICLLSQPYFGIDDVINSSMREIGCRRRCIRIYSRHLKRVGYLHVARLAALHHREYCAQTIIWFYMETRRLSPV